MLEKYDGDEFVCFDCETTGLNPKVDDIISIGAIKIKGSEILLSQKFEVLIKAKNNLDQESIKIHQIRVCDLEYGKDIDEAIDKFLEFIGNRTLVGYNIEFDVAMVNKYIKPKIGINLPNKKIEVSRIYYDKKNGSMPYGALDISFNAIMKNLDLPMMGKHDAINDAIMTAMIFLKLR